MADKEAPRRGYHDIGGKDFGRIDPEVTEMKPWERHTIFLFIVSFHEFLYIF